MRQKRGNVVGPVGRQPGKDVFQIDVGIVAIELRRSNQAHDRGGALSGAQRTGKQPVRPTDGPGTNLVLEPVMPTSRLCRAVNPRTQRLGGSLFPAARIVGIIREPPGRQATDLEVCSVSARDRSPWRVRARAP